MDKITQNLTDLLGPITEHRTQFSVFPSPIDTNYNVNEISKVQRELTEKILTDHFNFKEIIWVKTPKFNLGGKNYSVQTLILKDDINTNYIGKTCYLYEIAFTPKVYNPKAMYEPVKDGCVISPTLYNPETFEPKKSITITWNPEQAQDLLKFTNIDGNQFLINKLEKVLNNPKEYEPEGFRKVMIRMAVV